MVRRGRRGGTQASAIAMVTLHNMGHGKMNQQRLGDSFEMKTKD